MSHQAWLERPYEQRAAAADADEYAENMARSVGLDAPCDCPDPDLTVECVDVSTWRQGRYGGIDATVEVTCGTCHEKHSYGISDDNIDI